MGSEHEDPLVRRRDELRRIVYGTRGDPPAGAEEELVLIEGELALSERSRGAAGPPGPADRNAAVRPSDEAAHDAGHPHRTAEEAPREASGWRRRPLARWLLAASIALIGILFVIGPVRDLLSPPRGLDVFERAQTEEEQGVADQVATGAQLAPDAPDRLRSLGRMFGYQFWAYREGDRVCLLSQRQYFFAWEEVCTTLEDFRTHPLVKRIGTDDVRDGARPPRWQPGAVIVVTWGAMSMELEWEIEPAS